MAANSPNLSPVECSLVQSLMSCALANQTCEDMTTERMIELQRKGIVVRDRGQWKLTTLGFMFASVQH
jgi:hypothetical protein